MKMVRKKAMIILLLFAFQLFLSSAASEVYSLQKDYDAIERLTHSVFYVDIYDENRECIGNASGFVAFDEHLFITNQHVIDGAKYLKIWDEDNHSYVLDRVLLSDKEQDLAILFFPEGDQYQPLQFQLNADLKRGQPVTTIGSPEGLQNTVAFGNISAFPVIGGQRLIQFTAPISHGSSGGVLFNDSGSVIGITSSTISQGENIGFAVPVDILQDLYVSGRIKENLAGNEEKEKDSDGLGNGHVSGDYSDDMYARLGKILRDDGDSGDTEEEEKENDPEIYPEDIYTKLGKVFAEEYGGEQIPGFSSSEEGPEDDFGRLRDYLNQIP